jgi:hypothetical protein
VVQHLQPVQASPNDPAHPTAFSKLLWQLAHKWEQFIRDEADLQCEERRIPEERAKMLKDFCVKRVGPMPAERQGAGDCGVHTLVNLLRRYTEHL